MARSKSRLNMMMMSFATIGIVSVLWVLFGFSLAFGDYVGSGLIGASACRLSTLSRVTDNGGGTPIPCWSSRGSS